MRFSSRTAGLLALLLCGIPMLGGAMGDHKERVSSECVVVFDVWGYFESAGITNMHHRADMPTHHYFLTHWRSPWFRIVTV
jgi:hypothetical protein